MKKTITISLLFAASAICAHAEGLTYTDTYTYSGPAITLSSVDSSPTFSISDLGSQADKDKSFIISQVDDDIATTLGYGEISITFSVDEFDKAAVGAALNLVSVMSTGGQSFGLTLTATSSRNDICKLTYFGDEAPEDLYHEVYAGNAYTVTLSMNGSEGVTVSVVDHRDNPINFSTESPLSVAPMTGSFKSIVVGGSSNSTAGLTVNVSSGSGRAVKAEEKEDNAVPEPTTATLSLLALAGLAARRRRK